MKKFNNAYTTPEQSKRLLELGIPANSADCYYDHFGYKNIRDCEFELASNFFDNSIQKYYDKYEGAIPCWSVGRLMEIYLICNEVVCGVTELHHSAVKIDVREFTIVDYIIRKIENKIKKKGESFLSKLEE